MVLILAFTLVFSLAGCSDKKTITADEFKNIMEDEDFDVTDGSSDDLVFNDYDIDEVRNATKNDPSTVFVFIVFGSVADAKDSFKSTVNLEKEKIKEADLDVKTTTKSSGNYEKFTEKGEIYDGLEAYTVIIRIENTVLIAFVDGNSQSDVKAVDAIVSKLGY
jgi:hypothetical protein